MEIQVVPRGKYAELNKSSIFRTINKDRLQSTKMYDEILDQN